jgi:hypothetical protein
MQVARERVDLKKRAIFGYWSTGAQEWLSITLFYNAVSTNAYIWHQISIIE